MPPRQRPGQPQWPRRWRRWSNSSGSSDYDMAWQSSNAFFVDFCAPTHSV